MIRIDDKHKCCGCEACAQRCPKQCIRMYADNEGFLYPKVDISLCINCGICEQVCPELNNSIHSAELIRSIAANATDEDILMQSSSGGIFTLMANKIIDEGGVVFGARFDQNWNVIHDYTENTDGLDMLRRSKYVQSRIGDSFRKAEEFLKSGRKVLFTGTPCQIKGLKLFLKRDYENLLAVDIACHGVPSPLIWNTFLKEYIRGYSLNEISHINFRDKRNGWENYNFTVTLKSNNSIEKEISIPYSQCIYMKAFLNELILRPSCEKCNIKTEQNAGDLTIGDFWGISHSYPEFYNNKGVSIILCHTTKGIKFIDSLHGMKLIDIAFEHAKPYNGGFVNEYIPHRNRKKYFRGLHHSSSFCKYTQNMLKPSFKTALKSKIKLLLYNIK